MISALIYVCLVHQFSFNLLHFLVLSYIAKNNLVFVGEMNLLHVALVHLGSIKDT